MKYNTPVAIPEKDQMWPLQFCDKLNVLNYQLFKRI